MKKKSSDVLLITPFLWYERKEKIKVVMVIYFSYTWNIHNNNHNNNSEKMFSIEFVYREQKDIEGEMRKRAQTIIAMRHTEINFSCENER